MPEGLATADGQVIDLDTSERDFARAMLAPEPDEPEHPAPPRRPADPEAPFGRKVDGTPKKAPGGRPVKPRATSSAPAEAVKAKPRAGAGEPRDYTGPLGEFTSAVWMILAAAPVPGDELRLRLRAQARVLKDCQPGLCQGINLMAQHNGTIRRGVEALTLGNAGWVLPAVMAVAPFAVQSAQLWRTGTVNLTHLAAETDAEWAETYAAMQATLGVPEPGGAGHQGQAPAEAVRM